ncbi:MAG: bifunctional sterol desaturase/short chain dehydrogenase [Cyanobacteriota bacterium]|nr:bifunctional sterol desaturase/short chain dehydrogenase [Cyanobacteriota bacterium]
MASEFWLGSALQGLVALGSLLWAELVRDGRHALAHAFPRLMPKHHLHHKIFRRDLTVIDADLYRQSQWHHDVPESVAMLLAGLLLCGTLWLIAPTYSLASGLGVLYSLSFLVGGMSRGQGIAMETDLTHQPGAFTDIPGLWWVNRSYHWRHHFDDPNAYFSGTFTLLDRLMGTSLSLKGKTVAVTGASGSLGRALLQQLLQQGCKVIPLSRGSQPISLPMDGGSQQLEPHRWQIGQENELTPLLQTVDILILNHGVNVHGGRSADAIEQSFQVNTFSSWRLLELFLATVTSNPDIACKEVWVNTSEAEVLPAISPLYELSKRALGDLVTLRRLEAPCIIRKLILGPFRSQLNPIGVMSADWVARQIIAQAKRDFRNIIVTINPLTYLIFPLKETLVSGYFRLFSHAPKPSITPTPDPPQPIKST